MDQLPWGIHARAVACAAEHPIKSIRLVGTDLNLIRAHSIEKCVLRLEALQHLRRARMEVALNAVVLNRSENYQVEERGSIPLERYVPSDVTCLAESGRRDAPPNVRPKKDL